MPKYDLFLKPGESLSFELRSMLEKHFTEKDFEKLSKFGGRIRISLTAPFTDRKSQNKTFLIDENFLEEIKSNPSQANDIIKNLTKKQLIKIVELLNLPTSSKATTKEIKRNIVESLNSGNNWSSISGS